MLVPNQALRFYVTDENGETKRYKDRGIWILRSGKPNRVAITTGISDDDNTEITSGELAENDEVILSRKNNKEQQAALRMRMPR